MNKKENMIKFYKFALVGLSNTLVSYLVLKYIDGSDRTYKK